MFPGISEIIIQNHQILSIILPWDPADPQPGSFSSFRRSAFQAETEAIRQAYDDAIQVEPGWEKWVASPTWIYQCQYLNGILGICFFF